MQNVLRQHFECGLSDPIMLPSLISIIFSNWSAIDIVQSHHYRYVRLARRFSEKLDELDLIFDVQVRKRFIEKKESAPWSSVMARNVLLRSPPESP